MSDEKTPVVVEQQQTPTDMPGAAPTLASIPRPREQIQVDYTNTAGQLGNLVFQLEIMKQQRGQLMDRLNALGIEASKLPPEAPKPPKLVPQPPKAGSDGT
jgi:hypothetical protein